MIISYSMALGAYPMPKGEGAFPLIQPILWPLLSELQAGETARDVVDMAFYEAAANYTTSAVGETIALVDVSVWRNATLITLDTVLLGGDILSGSVLVQDTAGNTRQFDLAAITVVEADGDFEFFETGAQQLRAVRDLAFRADDPVTLTVSGGTLHDGTYLLSGFEQLEAGLYCFVGPSFEVEGVLGVGDSLSIDEGLYHSPGGSVVFNYQWLRDGVAIPEATSSQYTTVQADDGADLSCALTVADGVSSDLVMMTETRLVMPYFDEPDQTTGLLYWFNASDASQFDLSGEVVNSWTDSVAGVTLLANGTPLRGTRTINGLDAFEVDGASKVLSDGYVWNPSARTIIVVALADTVANTGMLIGNSGFGANSSRFSLTTRGGRFGNNQGPTQVPVGVPFMLRGDVAGVGNNIPYTTQINADAPIVQTTDFLNFNNDMGIGGYPDGGIFFDGLIGEILVYDHVLSAAEITNMQNYLNIKWGLGL